MRAKILFIGAGDLATRIIGSLIYDDSIGEIVIAGRAIARIAELAALLNDCGQVETTFRPLDALNPSAVERLLRQEQPDLLVQCASLLSPWHLHARTDQIAKALLAAGFALQLTAQLPIPLAVMQAVYTAGFTGPVINCSYPDVTNPVLARLGLAPTVGTGNVTMIARRVEARLRTRSEPERLVRVLAHHCHVTGCVRSETPGPKKTRPQVFVGEDGTRSDELVYTGRPLASVPTLNALSAASALPVIRALLPGSPPARLSIPGPLGLPGGYPIRIESGSKRLDLPPVVSLEEALNFHQQCAREDGIEQVQQDGTVYFTEEFRATISRIDPALAEPLQARMAYSRFLVLRRLVDSPAAAV
jgi:hypothetical protein